MPQNVVLGTGMARFRAGDLAGAAAVLAEAPRDGRAVTLLGMARAELGEVAAAEALFERALALGTEPDFALHMLGELAKRQGQFSRAAEFYARAEEARPDFAPHANSLGAALQRAGRHRAALAAFDRALAIDPGYATALCNRGLLREAARDEAGASADYRAVLALPPGLSAADWHTRGLACRHLRAFDAAAEASREALARDAGHLPAYLLLAEVLEALHREDDARTVRAELGRRQRIVSQPCFRERPLARLLLIAGSGLCNIPTDYVLDRGLFAVTLLHLAPGADAAENAALMASLPPFDLAWNVIGDADAGAAFLVQAEALRAALPTPVLNRPAAIAPTRRDLLPKRLAGIEGLVVPPVRRIGRADLARAARPVPWKRPWLIRPAGSHGGIDLRRIESRAALSEYLVEVPAREYHVSQFHDFRGADGLYRKARFVFVGGDVFPYHLAVCRDWLVHYWRAEMTAEFRAEEAAFLADPATLFPPAAMRAVTEVARRLELDFAGIDCALLRDGRVLLFEANATMLVHIAGSEEEFGHQHRHVPRIREALSELVLRKFRQGEGAALDPLGPEAPDPRHESEDGPGAGAMPVFRHRHLSGV